MKKYQGVRQTDGRLTSWQRKGKARKERAGESLGVAPGIRVKIILLSITHNIVVQCNNLSRPGFMAGQQAR